MINWTITGRDFIIEDGEGYIGFIYVITNLINDKKYVGQKRLWKTVTRPPLKGKVRKRKEIKQSDWAEYWGSSENLKKDIEIFGQENFKREIIRLCKAKGELHYMELKYQIDNNVLFRDDFYNNIVQTRIHGTHVSTLREELLKVTK